MADVSLTLLVLKTRKIEQLRLFYRTVGIEFVEEKHGKGPDHLAGRVGDTVIEIYPLPDDGTAVDSSTRLGFAIENLAGVVQALEGIGINVTPPRETAWGVQAVVRDPDGRAVELPCDVDGPASNLFRGNSDVPPSGFLPWRRDGLRVPVLEGNLGLG